MRPVRKKVVVVAALILLAAHAWGNESIKPFHQQIHTSVGAVKPGVTRVPIITWGGDMTTIFANGNARITRQGSIFAEKGLKLQLVREDDFQKQVEAYIRGESPYLRGTMGMINMAAQVLNRDARTKPVLIYQLTWSNGGDCLVVKKGINSAADLKGKTIALQAFGPHVDYLAKILSDAGLSLNDVNLKWTRDLTGTAEAAPEYLRKKDVDAAFAIIPDGLLLSSGGTVGSGADGSVRGARILLSTKTANRIIADVYAVRSDYFQAEPDSVKRFVHGLMLAEERFKKMVKTGKGGGEYQTALRASAEILLDSSNAVADTEALLGDVEFVGYAGNRQFFEDTHWPRNQKRLTDEIQSALITIGLLDRKTPLQDAGWSYPDFQTGLTQVAAVETTRFKSDQVAKVVAKKQAMGTLDEGELFSFEINFQPNQNHFSQDLYARQFQRVVDLAATYGGAIITIEGHSDPHRYNKLKHDGASELVLKRTRHAGKNLSVSRALEVKSGIQTYAASKHVPLDDSQLTVIGHGISSPKYPNPRTREEWLSNMRVVFRIIQVEAEASVFEPLN